MKAEKNRERQSQGKKRLRIFFFFLAKIYFIYKWTFAKAIKCFQERYSSLGMWKREQLVHSQVQISSSRIQRFGSLLSWRVTSWPGCCGSSEMFSWRQNSEASPNITGFHGMGKGFSSDLSPGTSACSSKGLPLPRCPKSPCCPQSGQSGTVCLFLWLFWSFPALRTTAPFAAQLSNLTLLSK